MNAGIISSRYAKAFLKYVQEDGVGDSVYSQSRLILQMMTHLPKLKEYLENSLDVSFDKKVALLSACLDSPLEPSIIRFLKMVTEHRRTEYFSRMLLSFIEQYRKANNILVGSLVTAVENDALRERLEKIFHDKTGAQVHFSETVDNNLIGGFVFELEGYRLDASVEGHLERIRRQLVEKNNRIV